MSSCSRTCIRVCETAGFVDIGVRRRGWGVKRIKGVEENGVGRVIHEEGKAKECRLEYTV